jgi:PAS domain S-box-containing protein
MNSQGRTRSVLGISWAVFLCAILVTLTLNPHSLIPLVSFLGNTLIGLYVFWENRPARLNRAFALMSISFALHSLLLFGLGIAGSPAFARNWVLITGIGLYMVPPTTLGFILVFTKEKRRSRFLLLYAVCLVSVLFWATSFVPAFQKEYIRVGVTYTPRGNLHYSLFIVFLGVVCACAVLKVVAAVFRAGTRHEKTQYKLFLAAALLLLLLGGLTALSSYGLPVYPLHSIGLVLYAFIIAYAILRHRFLDVEVLVKKGLVYLVLTLGVTGFYAGTMLGGEALLKLSSPQLSLPLNAAVIIAVAYLFHPLRTRIQSFVDRRFFRDRYDYRQALRRLSGEIVRTIGRRELAVRLADTVTETIKVTRSAVAVREGGGEGPFLLLLEKSFGREADYSVEGPPLEIPRLLQKRMRTAPEAVDREGLLEEAEGARDPDRAEEVRSAAAWLGEKGFELAVPIIHKDDLDAVFFLGPKLSEEAYSVEDVELLQICASQAGVALENSVLYDRTLAMQRYSDSLLQSMTSGLVSVDRDGRVVTVNRAGGEILGIRKEEADGKTLDNVFPENPELSDMLGRVLEGPGGVEGPVEVSVPGGEGKTLVAGAAAIQRGGGESEGALLLFDDVTERKRLERQLERSRRLAYLGEMASGVAHEIKNPLGSIKLFVESLLEHYDEPGYRENFTSIVLPEIDNLNQIVRDLLEYAKPPSLMKVETDVADLVRTTLRLLDGEIRERGVTVRFDGRGPEVQAPCDGEKIKRVLLNVIQNSLEAMDGREKRELSLDVSALNGRVRVEVRDTGGGIEEENIGKLFRPFFTTKTQGTGLGLAIAHKIVEDHEGSITVSSGPNQGTVTAIELPASRVS